MARSTSEIDGIIAELKTRRNTRDALFESAASALDSSNAKIAERLRSLKHVKQIAEDKEVCIACKVIKNSEGDPIAVTCTDYFIENTVVTESYTAQGLKTKLVDESFTVTGTTTVENL